MVHFNWTQMIPGVGHEYVHIATAAAACILIVVFSILGKAALGSKNEAATPSNRFSIKGFFEVIVEMWVGIGDMLMGPNGRKFIPLVGAVFLYVLVNNLLGMVPGMTPATDNMNTTFAIGIFSFVVYNALGFREHGFGYLQHFFGPKLPLVLALFVTPLFFGIELISHAFRPLTLGIRLMGNMTGDHAVLGIFLEKTLIGIPVIFYGLGLLVSVIQAFVFALLTMVYIMMAVSHDH